MNPLEYLQQVYGLEEFIRPIHQRGEPSSVLTEELNALEIIYAQKAPLVFWSSLSREDFDKNYRTLFEKIIAAMGFTLEQISLALSTTLPALPSETKVLILMDSTASELGWQNEKQLIIHGLPTLAKDAEAKKITWHLLKEVKSKTL